ncbi:DHA2 family methylenomycin A resistance protein-like MFS transporter [Pseudomonas marginalis]|jgi:MFS transporter, DHA2 family, methylenomycin A resistance protein|uniref:MFS transporter n=1 Tax=Pseudomonas marginalis TaxID=298 RepID=UPI00209D1715|nr:MFS transporter [Pseudomonas marginalis]MCP1507628.1 DHA2 family methylenomycin A resistance protein-like MFS transporter [Pseudomonas marginalis]MCP1525132.1 DHA2 family methylenomycin A resistance protein-like MFS transporter [Pseudomonas marginalis]MDQ0500273.1 DHA2 family methylenomycin A resistance protein-like MFS transporter [Pseudomonas marginalis]
MTPSPSLRAILIAACLGFLVVQLDVSVVNVGLGALKEAFNTDLTGLQWVINSYALPFSALLILGGAWGDKWGAKTVFAVGFAIFTLASIGCGLANSTTQLIAMRVIQGIGAALLIPTSLTLIRVSFQDPDKRRSAVALWGACGGIALAAGPVIGGLMIEYFGWRSVFLLNIPIGLLAIALILRYAPASPRVDKHIDIPGQISIAICVAALTYGLTESSAQGWVAATFSALAVALICAVAFILIERRVAHPMLPPHLARNAVLGSMALAGAAINLTFYGTVFVFSIYFQTFLHYDAFTTGLSFIPLTAVLTLSTLLSSRFAKRFSAPRIITTGFSVQIIGFLALSQTSAHGSPWLLNGALMLVGIGSAMSVPSITNAMLSSVSQHDAGIASGLMASARQLGGVIGVAVSGAMIASADATAFAQGMSNAMLLSALALLICIGVVVYVSRRP